jgi:hypothetical protein
MKKKTAGKKRGFELSRGLYEAHLYLSIFGIGSSI